MDSRWRRLLEEIAEDARDTAGWTGRPRFSERVMAALARVPRDRFVPEAYRAGAFVNAPLPIGYGQTISQPFIVALMTDLLDLEAGDRVLEIGTGCGYQTAVLAELAAEIHSIEYVPALAATAAATLRQLGYRNIATSQGQGREGRPEQAPFDAVMVTAAADDVPPRLVEQLKPGGRMVIPVAARRRSALSEQELLRLVKRADGTIDRRVVLPVAFVPLIGKG
ncbi:MAG: protein-L-isoaspartate(D-aspartate) O-methyltransferase [Alphaproteobacteria bacterium]